MNKERASFTTNVVTTLLAILPEYISPTGGKTDWSKVAATLNIRLGKQIAADSIKNWFTNQKERHKAWNELKKWTGIGWNENGCPVVDEESDKWKAFQKRYKSIANVFLKTPLKNEAEWDRILRGGYATGERSWAPTSGIDSLFGNKEPMIIEEEGANNSEEDVSSDTRIIETMNNEESGIKASSENLATKKRKCSDSNALPSKKSSREDDINLCLDILKKNMSISSSGSHSSPRPNKYQQVFTILESMDDVCKHGPEFVVDVLETIRSTPDCVEVFNTLPNNQYRLHFLKKHIQFPDDVNNPSMQRDDFESNY